MKKCAVRKIIFRTGLIGAAKAGQKSIVPARRAPTNQSEGPLHMYTKSPHSLQFQQSAEDHLSLVSLGPVPDKPSIMEFIKAKYPVFLPLGVR